MDGGVFDSLLNAPAAIRELWTLAGTLAPLTAPLPPQAALAGLFCAAVRLMLGVAAWEARCILPQHPL